MSLNRVGLALIAPVTDISGRQQEFTGRHWCSPTERMAVNELQFYLDDALYRGCLEVPPKPGEAVLARQCGPSVSQTAASAGGGKVCE